MILGELITNNKNVSKTKTNKKKDKTKQWKKKIITQN